MSDTSPQQNAADHDPSIPPAAIRCISGLIYQVLKPGRGPARPGPEDVVQVVYSARTETGQPVDTSGDPHTPRTLSVSQVMPGLAEALQLMTVGQSLRLWIPPHLTSDEPEKAPEGTLIFDITLVDFTRMRDYPSLPTELTSPRQEE